MGRKGGHLSPIGAGSVTLGQNPAMEGAVRDHDGAWWAKGLIFENCNCRLLCPGHLNYRNLCDYERCLGHWAIHFDEGELAGARVDGLNVFIVVDTPQRMVDGGWREAIYLDERCDDEQAAALEAMFKGELGGTWATLAALVADWSETRRAAIEYRDEGKRKSMRIDGMMETEVEAIKSGDRVGEARLENVHNQIHASSQVLALGTTRFSDRGMVLDSERTHAIYSNFRWQGP